MNHDCKVLRIEMYLREVPTKTVGDELADYFLKEGKLLWHDRMIWINLLSMFSYKLIYVPGYSLTGYLRERTVKAELGHHQIGLGAGAGIS